MIDRIKNRLKMLGIDELNKQDEVTIACLAEEKERDILNYCNLKRLPPELENNVIKSVCGEMLRIKKLSGEVAGISLAAAVSSLSEGDVSFSFDSSISPEKRLDAVIDSLIASQQKNLNSFRKLRW